MASETMDTNGQDIQEEKKDNEIQEKVEQLLKIDDKTKLEIELYNILIDNKALKAKIHELEESKEAGFSIDTDPIDLDDDDPVASIQYKVSNTDILTLPVPGK
jgi:phosphoribosyl-dephospho-CoA transferase